MRLQLSHSNGYLARLYLPVTRDGKAEHLIIDSGTARTWFRMDQGAAEWKDDAFVATIGNAKLHVLGRKVPAFKEQVRGHSPVGALGNDLLVDGFTELDLARGRLLRHTSISPELLAWPTLPFTIDRGIMYARVQMDGKERLLQIDTGAPNSMLITPTHTNRDARFDRSDVYGHKFPSWLGTGMVTLAGVTQTVPLERMPAFPHFQNDVAQALGVPLEGILGLSALGKRRIIIDAPAGVLRLQPHGTS